MAKQQNPYIVRPRQRTIKVAVEEFRKVLHPPEIFTVYTVKKMSYTLLIQVLGQEEVERIAEEIPEAEIPVPISIIIWLRILMPRVLSTIMGTVIIVQEREA